MRNMEVAKIVFAELTCFLVFKGVEDDGKGIDGSDRLIEFSGGCIKDKQR